jgi:hypothetical protein
MRWNSSVGELTPQRARALAEGEEIDSEASVDADAEVDDEADVEVGAGVVVLDEETRDAILAVAVAVISKCDSHFRSGNRVSLVVCAHSPVL